MEGGVQTYLCRALSCAGKWGQSGVRKSECLFDCLSGVFGACIMHSHFNNLISDIICSYYVIRPGSLVLSVVHFSYVLVCLLFFETGVGDVSRGRYPRQGYL